MLYSPAEKRKIILDNYNHPTKQVELAKLEEISISCQVPFATFRSLDRGCGDILHLLINQKDGYVKECFFSGQQSCLITVAAANILCSYLVGKSVEVIQELLNNCQLMIEGKKYCLDNCPELAIFSDLPNFPHRVECVRLVIRGVKDSLIN